LRAWASCVSANEKVVVGEQPRRSIRPQRRRSPARVRRRARRLRRRRRTTLEPLLVPDCVPCSLRFCSRANIRYSCAAASAPCSDLFPALVSSQNVVPLSLAFISRPTRDTHPDLEHPGAASGTPRECVDVFTVLSTTSHNLLLPRTFNCAQIRCRSSSSHILLTFKLLTLDASQPRCCDKRYGASRTSLLVAHQLAKGCGHSGARDSRACATATGRRCGPNRRFNLIACSTRPPRMHLVSGCPIVFLPQSQCGALISPHSVCFDSLLWPCPSNSIFPPTGHRSSRVPAMQSCHGS
jgi:hypothetical protein